MTIVLTETKRRRVAGLLVFIHSLLALLSLAHMAIGVYIKWTLAKFTVVLEGHYGGAFCHMLVAVGILLFLEHVVTCMICIMCMSWRNRVKCRLLLLPTTVMNMVLPLLTLVTAIMCYHVSLIVPLCER